LGSPGAPGPSRLLFGEGGRRFRIGLVGSLTFETTGLAPAAVEHSQRVLDQIFEQYGLQLGISGVEILGVGLAKYER
jgi:hypothetical protein